VHLSCPRDRRAKQTYTVRVGSYAIRLKANVLVVNVRREVLNIFFAEENIYVIPNWLIKKLTVLSKLLGDDLPDFVAVRDV
jgi:hypothetical protein